MQVNISVEEALKNLDLVAAAFKGTRQDHVALQLSLEVLRNAVSNKQPAE